MRTKKKVFTSTLPPTPCTPEMRERLVTVAAQNGQSLAELQREAVGIFLLKFDTNGITKSEVMDQKAS